MISPPQTLGGGWARNVNYVGFTLASIQASRNSRASVITFEATRGPKSFWDWADELTEYDLTVKGLRTLRHFEAHVVEMPHSVTVQVRMSEEIVSGETNTRTHKIYGLPALQPARLAGLRQPTPLDSTDLNAWNERVSKTSVADLFKYGLEKLNEILLAAEGEI